ncbi:MAG: hypothetical protein R6X28_05635 [Bacteroidales bacterium]
MKAKSKQDLATEYGVSLKTFNKWLKKHNIKISRGLITPKDQEKIYDKLGFPKKD